MRHPARVAAAAARSIIPLVAVALFAAGCGVHRPPSAAPVGAPAQAQGASLWGDLPAGPHAIGVEVRTVEDWTRPFAGTGARALRTIVWYPAVARADGGAALSLGGYAARLLNVELPAGGAVPDSVLHRLRPAVAVAQDPGVPPGRLRELLDLRLRARPGLRHAPGRSPLVVISQGYGYESPLNHVVLAEFLASHGYVVAAAPLMGASSPVAALAPEDVEAAVRDAETLIGALSREPYVDAARVAAGGFDLGGMTAAAAASRDARVRAVFAYDSGVLSAPHVANLLRPLPGFSAARLGVPMLLSTRRKEENAARGTPEDAAALDSAAAERYIVRAPGMRHVDFTVYGLVEDVLPGFWGAVPSSPAPRHRAVLRATLAFLDATFARNAGAGVELTSAGLGNVVEVEHIRGRGEPDGRVARAITHALSGDVQAGAALLREAVGAGARPGEADRERMMIAANVLLYRRGDAAAAYAWLAAAAELFPAFAPVRALAGDAAVAVGDPAAAARWYDAALALSPDDARLREKRARLP